MATFFTVAFAASRTAFWWTAPTITTASSPRPADAIARAPYQFSNEVIREFRVSSNGYSAELGRAGGAVFNVVTNSGGDHWHGTGFFYVREPILTPSRPTSPANRTKSSGNSAAPTAAFPANRVFLYLGYDQRQLTVPSLVQFGNGASSVVPQADDNDRKDKTWSSPRPSSSTPWLANTPHRWAATPDSPSST